MEKRTLLTIITEGIIEQIVVEEAKKLGAKGYTVVEARGEGTRGVREAQWSETANVRIEIICDKRTADAITARMKEQYYPNYAMVIFSNDVEVQRPEKF
jgi:nitrogen regulatory protein PII